MIKLVLGLLFGFIFAILWLRVRWPALERSRLTVTRALGEALREESASATRVEALPENRTQGDLQSTIERQAIELKELKYRLDRAAATRPVKAPDARLAEQDATIRELRSQLDGGPNVDALQRTISDQAVAINALKADLAAPPVASSSEAVDASASEQLRQMQEERDQLSKQCTQFQDQCAGLQSELDRCTQRVEDLQAEATEKTQLLGDVHAELETLRATVENQAGVAASAPSAEPQPAIDLDVLRAALPKTDRSPDNLKKIRGVGEKIEKLLNGMGLTTFEQVAALNEEQVNQVAAALKLFPDRMVRDEWMGQAEKLHAKFHGGKQA